MISAVSTPGMPFICTMLPLPPSWSTTHWAMLLPLSNRLVPTSVTKSSVSTPLAQRMTGTPWAMARSTGALKAARPMGTRIRASGSWLSRSSTWGTCVSALPLASA